MTTPDAERQVHPLGRYWNEVAAGGPAQPDDLDPALAETVRRIQAIGAAPTPDPAFAAALWEDLMHQATNVTAPLPRPFPAPNGAPSGAPPRSPGTGGRAPAWGRASTSGGWWPRLEFVAIALLTVALVAGLVAMNGGLPGGLPGGVGSFVGQDDASDDGGTLLQPMGSVVEIGDAPVDLLVYRVTLTPGARWDTPAAFTIESLESGSLVSRADVAGAGEQRMRVGSGSAGSAYSSNLRNDQSEPAVLFQALIGPDLPNLEFPEGVTVDVLAAARVTTLPAGQALASIEAVLLAPSEQQEIDTGRDGLALVMVEDGTVSLSGQAGRIELDRADGSGAMASPVADPRRPPQTVPLAGGDTALLQGGAVLSLGNDTEERVRALVLTINPGAAQTQVMTGKSESIADAVYGTPPPEAMEGFSVGPAGTPTVDAEVPAPEACAVAPRSAASLDALLAAGPASTAVDPEASGFRAEGELPQGSPLDAATLAAITDVEREFAACLNAGDWSRNLALLTDDAVRGLLGEDAAFYATLAADTPEPLLPDEQVGLFPLRGARLLPDGRVGAIVDWGQVGFENQPRQVTESNFHIYERVDGRWLIAEEISTGR